MQVFGKMVLNGHIYRGAQACALEPLVPGPPWLRPSWSTLRATSPLPSMSPCPFRAQVWMTHLWAQVCHGCGPLQVAEDGSTAHFYPVWPSGPSSTRAATHNGVGQQSMGQRPTLADGQLTFAFVSCKVGR